MGEDDAMDLVLRRGRKCLSAVLALLLLCFSHPAFAATLGEDPDVFRAFLQKRYDIVIYMGDEFGNRTIGDTELRIVPVKATPFLHLFHGNKRFAGSLINLDKAIAVYPPGFFSRFRPALQFWLADEVLVRGIRAGGCFIHTDEYRIIALSRLDSGEKAPHHEIWHAMEQYILDLEPDAFDRWELLNPEGFAYTGDYSVLQSDEARSEPDDWFVSEYAKVSANEDRAMVFDALMTEDESWWNERPHLCEKAKFLLEKAEPYFGEIIAAK